MYGLDAGRDAAAKNDEDEGLYGIDEMVRDFKLQR